MNLPPAFFVIVTVLCIVRVDYFVTLHRAEHRGREWYELELSEEPDAYEGRRRDHWRAPAGERKLPVC